MNKRVSIIIPCYNAEQFIDAGLQSIHEQDYPDVELIVVNDGSTDGSEAKILAWENKFREKGVLFKYFRQDNQGQAAATNLALKYVTGEYLTLLDADDYFLPGSIAKRAVFLEGNPDFAGVRSNGWTERGGKRELFITTEKEKNITDMFSALSFGETNNWAGTYMVRTDILFQYYPNRDIYLSRFGQNLQILLPVAYKQKFGYIDEPLMVYVLHGDSHSQAGSLEMQYKKDEFNAQGYRKIYEHMLDMIVKDPEEHREYLNAYHAAVYRCAMQRDIKYGKLDAMEHNYHKLCGTGLANMNDRIAYFGTKKSPIVFPLKVIRRCKMLLKMD